MTRVQGVDGQGDLGWLVVWRRAEPDPRLAALLRRFTEVAQAEGWLRYDPDHDWLPATDRADASRQPVL